MEINVLINNYSKEGFLNEHGLSIVIYSGQDKFLFDTGQSDAFLANAKKLGLDMTKVTKVIISHGHYDHGGGIESFLGINKDAEIYLQEGGFLDYYSKRDNSFIYIGLNKDLENNQRINKVGNFYKINEKAFLFGKVNMVEDLKSSNDGLFKSIDGSLVKDTFDHEISLCVEEGGEYYLFLGCGHRGVKNILEECKRIIGKYPQYVFGGFHLSSKSVPNVSATEIERLKDYLLSTGATFYTGHCTGYDNYLLLKEFMGDRIEYIKAGEKIKI